MELIFYIILVILMIIVYNGLYEKFKISKSTTSEYIPQNMGIGEFKQINKWDYPGYLNN